jgi:ABC-type transport system substrate-binding protein
VFDTLTEVAGDGTLQPELATGWSSSADARVWTFDLRKDAVFHDQSRFTAADAAASLAARLDATVEATGRHSLRIALGIADTRLPLTLSQPDYIIRPVHDLQGSVGTGLYRVRSFAPGQRLLTERVASHYKDGRAGWFDEVELTSIPSEAVRAQALAESLVDAADLSDVRPLAGLREVRILPDRRQPALAAAQAVMQPAQVSHLRPFDNLRAPERWWFA